MQRIEEFVDYISRLAGKFAFHLSDTHGIPFEVTKKKLEGMTYLQFFNLLERHKDFDHTLPTK
jgi:alanyl-tRNA synthetase